MGPKCDWVQYNKQLINWGKLHFWVDPKALKNWQAKKLVGYNRWVVVESMISRWKRLYGGDLKSRCAERKKREVKLKAMMINLMIEAQAA